MAKMFSGSKKKGRGRKSYATLGNGDHDDDAPPPNFAFSIDEDDDPTPIPTPSSSSQPPLSPRSDVTNNGSNPLYRLYHILTFNWLNPLLDLGNSVEVRLPRLATWDRGIPTSLLTSLTAIRMLTLNAATRPGGFTIVARFRH